MKKEVAGKEYPDYVFEDFLTDDHFILSIKNPTKETEAFWTAYLSANPEREPDFRQAEAFVRSANERAGGTALAPEEKAELFERISVLNARGGRSVSRPRRLYKRIAVAVSCAAALLGGVVLFDKLGGAEPEIISFVKDNPFAGNVVSTVLVVGDNKTMEFTETESSVVYANDKIIVNDDEVAEKEASGRFNQLILAKGKRTNLTLPDGTRMWINGGSRVVYPVEFKGKTREIYLDGEAYFDVARNEDSPFLVRTDAVNVKVLGTKFNISSYSSDYETRVVLVSGSVSVKAGDSGRAFTLKPNEMLECGGEGVNVAQVDTYHYVSWIDGLYLYDNEKLENIAARLSRYYGLDIVCDETAAGLQCTGKLDMKDDIEEVLQGVAFTAPVTFAHIPPSTYLITHSGKY